ncbi:DNA cytosine methyltransferase [Undibacterium crateris]|uniref:DNA cytosine methyltransferase n=1 Tax=Undibacterium crateris TaxID=2528175 RepID=UPI00138A6333|nr:DNA cytosine methyltransferase [Undibacterium crateris]NDI85037.1 DNA methyltransferase [Undibacterium crateris]
MRRDNFTMQLGFPHELIIDNFAGGGGTSEGLEQALGRPVDIAINHDPEALAMHAINHPHTMHICESVWDVDPIKVTNNQPVGLVWLSPDCKHFSKAKGGTPVEKRIRGLAWIGMRWAAKCKPRMIMLENVEEFQDWGPLIIDASGEARPDPSKKGKTFESFVRQLRGHGYQVDWRELRACNDGAPTIRKRLFLVARRDGVKIGWPDHAYGAPTNPAVLARKLLPWATAAQCIDFSIPAQSIFSRKRPLVVNTERRIAKGLLRHVLTSAKPFIVSTSEQTISANPMSIGNPLRAIAKENFNCPILAPFLNEHANASSQRTMPADAPLRTVCAQVKGGHFSVVAPTLTPMRGTSEAHLGGHDINAPLSTISAGGTHHGLTSAHLVTIGHGERARQCAETLKIEPKLNDEISDGVHKSLIAAFLEQANGGFYDGDGRGVDEPVSTITSSGSNQRLVMAYCIKYYSSGGQWQGLTEPMHTLPTKARMGLVQTVQIAADCLDEEHRERARLCAKLLHTHLPEYFTKPAEMVIFYHSGQWWVLVDITLRMLKARELFNAQGFPSTYIIDEIPNPSLLFSDGIQVANPLEVPRIPLSTVAQVRMCGNSVSPNQAKALAIANFKHEKQLARVA